MEWISSFTLYCMIILIISDCFSLYLVYFALAIVVYILQVSKDIKARREYEF